MRPQDFRVTNHFVPLHPIFGLFTNPMENMTEIFFFIFWEFLVSGNLTVCTREIPSYPFLSDKIYSYCFLFLLGWFPSIRKICVSLRRGYFYTFQAFFLSLSLPDDFVLYHLLFNQQEWFYKRKKEKGKKKNDGRFMISIQLSLVADVTFSLPLGWFLFVLKHIIFVCSYYMCTRPSSKWKLRFILITTSKPNGKRTWIPST
jgi:hypothetical protein